MATKKDKGGKSGKKGKEQVASADDRSTDLLSRPKEYNVKFHFPDPPPLNGSVLGAKGKRFCNMKSSSK